MIDTLLSELDKALKILTTKPVPRRTRPDKIIKEDKALNQKERVLSARLMRVNHTGEVCAQGLYQGQLFFNKNSLIKSELEEAAQEEIDHLSWCESRIEELEGKKSKLNPIFYFGSFVMGSIASIIDEKYNLGFLEETEKQVTDHLSTHLIKIPKKDVKTKKILEKIQEDEKKHQASAKKMGAAELPKPLKELMKITSKIMTITTYRI
tara:strand:+ start:502 stop:1125 length:624 start_codon:yes stop_codon:yes gene_type:complete